MDERVKRVERNEELFKALNEQVEQRVRLYRDAESRIAIVCECGDVACADQVSIPLERYEAVRQNEHDFIIRPGHQIPDVEDITYRSDDYFIVRKHDPS